MGEGGRRRRRPPTWLVLTGLAGVLAGYRHHRLAAADAHRPPSPAAGETSGAGGRSEA